MGRTPGIHESFERDEDMPTSSDRSFGFVFAGFTGLIAAIQLYLGGHRWPYWLGASAVFLVCALALPRVLAPLNRLWTAFSLLLYRVMNPLIMGLLFFLVVTPIGLLLRIAGKDPLHRKADPAASSYWIPREPPGPQPDSMPRQF